jgi:hypothetical protein
VNALVIAIALVVGRARGGRIRDIIDYPFRGSALFLWSLLLQLALGTAYAETQPWLRPFAPIVNLASMGLLLWAIALNWRLAATRPIALGVSANLLVIFANGGRMPVSPEALRAVGMPASRVAYLAAGRSLTHRMMGEATALSWLGDWLYFPPPVARSPVFSVGDVLLSLGIFLLIHEIMGQGAQARRLAAAAQAADAEAAAAHAADAEAADARTAALAADAAGAAQAHDGGQAVALDPPAGELPRRGASSGATEPVEGRP